MDRLIALAGRARAGDRDALEELLEASAGLVHAVARSRLGESLAAEGAAVDALARAAQHIGRLKDAKAYPHWLYRIAARCAASSRPQPLAPVPDAPDPGRGPVETLVAAERAQLVRAAVARLPARLREPVYLHFAEGLSYRDVATVLQIGLGSVSRRVKEALELLRARLGGTAC